MTGEDEVIALHAALKGEMEKKLQWLQVRGVSLGYNEYIAGDLAALLEYIEKEEITSIRLDELNKTWNAFSEETAEEIKALVAGGADIDARNEIGRTALHYVAYNGNTDVVSLLLDRGADVNAVEEIGRTALHYAANNDNTDVVSLLLDRGADVNAVEEDDWTALHCAANNGKTDVVSLLLDRGADVNAVEKIGRTALHYAAEYGNTDVVSLLLDRGADVNAVEEDGRTALHYAADHGNTDVVSLLLHRGADVNAVDEIGRTALHYVAYNGKTDVVSLLLDRGANVNAVKKIGRTALHYAAEYGNTDVVSLLLDRGADVNAVEEIGRTALHYAANNDNTDVVSLLLDRGADVNAVEKDGRTALHYAAEYGNTDVVSLLLHRRANIDAVDKENHSPLIGMIWTISKEDLDEKIAVARLLLSSGSNPNYLSVSVAKASLEQHRMGLLACAHHWHDCYEKGKPLTMIPSEVIEGGEDAVRTFLDDLEKTSADQLVYRSKVCIVGPSTWGKTSLVKSMTKNEPLPENIEDRTIGIDLFPFTFKENSNDGTTSKQHDVTFWDFAGQDIYHVTHALFFSERTMYLICVDLSVYAKKLEEVKMCTALKQTVVMERFFEENVLRWVRFILFRQPSAQFKVIGTKVDLVSDIEVKHISSDMNCHMTSFLKNLDKEVADEAKDALDDVFKPSNLVVFSAKLEDSIAKARQSIEQAIIDKPNLSIMMPATYSQVLAQIVKTRRPDANATPANRVQQVIVPFRALFNKLMDVPNLEDAGKCQAILRVLHNLGDILWYEDNGKDRDSIANPDELIILDPKLMLDIVSEVVNHNYDTRKGNLYEALRRDGTLHHSLLITFTWWEALKEAGDNMVPLFKRFLQHFNLAYPASIAEKLDEVDMIVPMYWKTRAEAQETVKPLAKQPSMLTRISVTGSAFAKWKYSLPAAISEAVYVNFVVQCYRQDAARNVEPAHVECFVRGEFCAVIKFVADKSGRCDDIEIEVAAATHEVAWAEMRDIVMSMENVLRKYPGLKSMKQGMLERYIVKPDDDGEHDHIVVSGLVANPSELKQKRFKMPWLPLDFDWYIQRAWENPGKLEELRAQKITLQLPHRLDVLRQLVVSSETRQLPALWTLLYSKETSEIVLRIHSDISGLYHHVPLRITVPNKFVMEHSDSIQAGVLVLSVLSSLIPTDIAKTAVEMALSVSSTALDHAQTVNSILAKAGLSPGKARSATEFDMPISSRAALLRDILKLHDSNFDHLKVSELSNLRSAAHNETGRFVWVHERELEEMKDHLTPRDLPPPPPASNSISTTTSTPIPLPTHSPKATRVSTPVVSPTSTTIVPSTSRPIATSISIRVTKLVWPGRAKGRKKIYCEWEIVHQLKRAGNGKTEEAADLGADIEWSSQSEKLVNVSSIIMLQESTVKIFVKQRRQFLKCFRDKVIGLGAVQLKDHKDRFGSASSNSKPVHIEIALAGMKIPQSSTVTCEISIEQ